MSVLDSKRFTALGREWTARFDFNAVCEVEERTGRGFVEVVGPFLGQVEAAEARDQAAVLNAMKALKMRDIRLVLEVALQGKHPDVDAETAGAIITAIGLTQAMAVVGWAIMRGLALADDQEPDEDEGNAPSTPTTRKRGGKAG